MKKIFVDFQMCIDVEFLIDFIEKNSDWTWNEICNLENNYRNFGDFDNTKCYPLVEYGETDTTKFQYWVEAFMKTYSEDIGDKTIYIMH